MVQQVSGITIKDNVLCGPEANFQCTQGIGRTLFEKLKECADEQKIAQIDGDSDKDDTYKEFLERCIRSAITLRQKGIQPGDVISVCSFNNINLSVALIAGYFVGAKQANTDPRISLTDTIFLLKQVKPKIIFVCPQGLKLIEEASKNLENKPEIITFEKNETYPSFSDFLKESPEEKDFQPIDVKDVNETAAIFFSSGTTGLPKGICLNHKSLLFQTFGANEVFMLASNVTLSSSSAYWLSYTFGLLMSVWQKSTRVISSNLEYPKIFDLVEKYKVGSLLLTPSEVATIAKNGIPKDVDIPSLKMLLFGGSPFSKEQMEDLRTLLPAVTVLTGYGQTELSGVATGFSIKLTQTNWEGILKRPTTCGHPIHGYFVKIADLESGEALGPNQEGEIRVKTDYAMNGYYEIDSSEQWDADGFLKTGDIGYYDEEYFVYCIDRIKGMLKYQGWQIASAKLEGILGTHPEVERAAVVGLPHPVDGDHPMAFVVLKKGHHEVAEKEIEKFVEERVDDKQRLRGGVKIVKKLYFTVTGKINRKLMKDLFLSGKL